MIASPLRSRTTNASEPCRQAANSDRLQDRPQQQRVATDRLIAIPRWRARDDRLSATVENDKRIRTLPAGGQLRSDTRSPAAATGRHGPPHSDTPLASA